MHTTFADDVRATLLFAAAADFAEEDLAERLVLIILGRPELVKGVLGWELEEPNNDN